MKKMQRNLASLVLGAVLLAGCGQAVAPTSVGGASYARKPIAQQPNGQYPSLNGQTMNGQPGQASQAQAEGLRLQQGLIAVMGQAKGMDATLQSYSQGHFKSGARVSELRQATTSAKFTWVKPNKLRAEVITSTNSLLEGAAMATTDGQNLKARAKGLLSLFAINVTATDNMMKSNRNVNFSDNTPGAQLSRLTAPGAVWTVVGQDQVQGTPVTLVQVDNIRRLDSEITREIVAIEPRGTTLRRLTMYANNTKVTEHTFLNFRWNPSVTASTFTI